MYNLINFNNGVYDFNTFTFKPISEEDKSGIRNSVGYDYVEEFSKNLDELTEFLSEIQPDQDGLGKLLGTIAVSLAGGKRDRKINGFVGEGPCGKTTIIELLRLTFGDLFSSVHSNGSMRFPYLISEKIIVKINGETNEDQIKSLLENNQDSKLVNLYFDLYILSDYLPDFSESMKDKYLIINFPNQFVKNPTKPNQKSIKYDLFEKMKNWI
jgi:phage/plasmid-associated DNA primase